jgi:multimeric flavodoxin WrbA
MVVVKVLGILGSPCTDGNTAALLDAVLEGASKAGAEVERLNITDLSIEACDSCGSCDSTGECQVKGDDMDMIYRKIREVDALVIASPVFFMSVTAQLKALIDRCQCFWIEKFVLERDPYKGRRRPLGLLVATAGSGKAIVFESAIHVAKAFFIAISYDYSGEVLLGETDRLSKSAREEAISKARAAGKSLVS